MCPVHDAGLMTVPDAVGAPEAVAMALPLDAPEQLALYDEAEDAGPLMDVRQGQSDGEER